MAFDQLIDPDPDTPKLVSEMNDDEYMDFINEQSFPCSDPPPYYGGYRKAGLELTP